MSRRNFFQQTQRRRYQDKGRENPYFRRVRKIPWKWIGGSMGGVAIIVTVCVILFSHRALAIQRVSIDGLNQIDRMAFETEVRAYLDQRALLFFHRSNQFLFSGADFQLALEGAFTFASISISQAGKELRITVKERTSNLLWETDKEYVVDLQGVITRPLQRDVPSDAELAFRLPLFYDINQVAVLIGVPVLTPEEITQVFRFHEILLSQGIPYTQTRVNRLAGGWMSIVTQVGYEIYFDVTGDIEAQGESLKTVLATQVEDPEDLEYIDLRFGDHVYFK